MKAVGGKGRKLEPPPSFASSSLGLPPPTSFSFLEGSLSLPRQGPIYPVRSEPPTKPSPGICSRSTLLHLRSASELDGRRSSLLPLSLSRSRTISRSRSKSIFTLQQDPSLDNPGIKIPSGKNLNQSCLNVQLHRRPTRPSVVNEKPLISAP